MRRKARRTLGAALRARFKSPRDALKALGIDAEKVLRAPDLAYDARDMSGPEYLRREDQIVKNLSGSERAREMLLLERDFNEPGCSLDEEEKMLNAADEEEIRRRVDRAVDYILNHPASPLTEDDEPELRRHVEDHLRRRRSNGRDSEPHMPRNALPPD